MNNRNEPSIINNIVQQSKGALRMFFLINIAIAALNIWILKDNRHFEVVLTHEDCSAVTVSAAQRDAFNQFPVGQ